MAKGGEEVTPGLYDLYVQFELWCAWNVLSRLEPGAEQNAFLATFYIRSREEFEGYFLAISEYERQRVVKRWSLAYERRLERVA